MIEVLCATLRIADQPVWLPEHEYDPQWEPFTIGHEEPVNTQNVGQFAYAWRDGTPLLIYGMVAYVVDMTTEERREWDNGAAGGGGGQPPPPTHGIGRKGGLQGHSPARGASSCPARPATAPAAVAHETGGRMDDEAMEAATLDLARSLATNGQAGAPPEWWDTMQAARYLGVGPWELEPHSGIRRALWRDRALIALRAEHVARQLQQAAAVQAAQARQQGAKLVVPV